MATVSQWNPYGVSLNVTATVDSISRSSASQYKVTFKVSWECYWDNAQTNYGMSATSGGVTKVISSFGTKRHSGSASFTGTYSISGNAGATKNVTVTFKNYEEDWQGDVTKSASKAITLEVKVPAWTSYTVKYDDNVSSGVSNMPSSQTKWKDQALTLSSTKPTRTGYTFSKWNTKSDGTGTSYSAGAKYEANAGATLYAQWTANKYTITYDANGGTLGSVKTQTKTYGVDLALTGTATRTNYTFLGWSTSKTATSATYAAGATFTANANTTLYAVWKLAYVKPTIKNLSIERCDENKKPSDEGTYGVIKFDWSTTYEVTSISVTGGVSGSTETSTVTKYPGGKNGHIDERFGGGALLVDTTYDFVVTVTDSGGSTSKSGTINGSKFAFDALPENKGVAFGGPATIEGAADFFYNLIARGDVNFYTNNKKIFGRKPDGTLVDVFIPQNQNGNTVIGYDNYDLKNGDTNIYGHDLNFGVSNMASPGYYRPYRRKGDTLTYGINTAGYVTNSGKNVSFWLPVTEPIIGSPTVTAASLDGFTLRQGGKYTHGCSASISVVPDSYEANIFVYGGIRVTAKFTNVTDVTNNDAIGIYWNGTITLS